MRNVEEERARSVRNVRRALARQAQAHIVLRQKDCSDLLPDFGLVLAHPEHLRKREARERGVAGQLDETLRADPLRQRATLLVRALVAPDKRRTKGLVALV